MERKTAPQKITALEEELTEIKSKLDKLESNKRWYHNHSFVLSLIAFLFSASLSVYTLRSSQTEKKRTSYSTTISAIKTQLSDLKNVEKEFIQQTSNPNLDNNTRNAFSSLFYSKVDQTVEEISRKMRTISKDSLETTILNDYAKYLAFIGKYEEALKVNHIALKNCRENYTKVTIMRTLANQYSIPSDSQSLAKSREYRQKALRVTKSYSGEYATENTMQSFELWASDEYYNFNNKAFANALVDSALLYANKLQEFNVRKYDHIKRLREMVSYFNGRLNINFNSGMWKIAGKGGRIGSALITFANNNYFIDIDIMRNNVLVKKIMGNGRFVSDNKMRFNLSGNYLKTRMQPEPIKLATMASPMGEYRLNKEAYPQQVFANLELEIVNNRFIRAKYVELDQPPQQWSLAFVRN